MIASAAEGKTRAFAYAAVLAALCTALYAGSLRYPFLNWDDYNLITMNPYITELTWSNIADIFTPGVVGAYQPLRTLTYALDYSFWGLDPTGYHATNLIFYILTCVCVFAFIDLFLKNLSLALLGALFFAAHPLHVEAVTWLSARKETLSGFLFVLSLILYARSTRGGLRYYAASLFTFVLALLSKPTVVILPGLVIMYDLCFVTGGSLRKLARRTVYYAPYVLLSAALTYITMVLSSRGGVLKEFHGGSFWTQLLTSATVFIKNIRLLVVPVDLSPRYVDYFYSSLRDVDALLAVVSCALLALLAWDMWGRSKVVFFCLMWYPITFFPVSNLVPISTLMADRYLFLPSVGYALLVAYVVGGLIKSDSKSRARRSLRPLTLAGCVVVLVLFSLQTVKRNQVWKDSVSLWSSAVEQDSTNVLGHFALGNVYMENQKPRMAILSYRRAIFLSPSFATAHSCLANAYLADGEVGRAIYHYNQALRNGSREDMAIYGNLGMAYEVKGMFDEAIEQYERALEVDSTSVMARLGIAESYSRKKQHDKAIEAYKDLIQTNEEFMRARVYYSLGVAQHQDARFKEAIDSYARAIEVDSTFAEAYYGLGNAYYRLRDFDDAVSDFKKAVRLAPNHIAAVVNLGNTYLEIGRLDDAISTYKTALDSSPSNLIALNNLGLAYVERGDLNEASATFEDLIRYYPKDPTGYINLGYVLMRRGDHDGAKRRYGEALELDAESSVAHYNMACVHALSGDLDAGLKELERAIELGFKDRRLLREDPDLRNLRGKPQFEPLLRDL